MSELGKWRDAYSVALYDAGMLVSVRPGGHTFHPRTFPARNYVVSCPEFVDFLKSIGKNVTHPYERKAGVLRDADDFSIGYHLREYVDWSYDVAVDRLRIRIDGPGVLSLRILLKHKDDAVARQEHREDIEILYCGSFSVQWNAEVRVDK